MNLGALGGGGGGGGGGAGQGGQGDTCLICSRRFAPSVLAVHFKQCFDGYSPVERTEQQHVASPAAGANARTEFAAAFEHAAGIIPHLGGGRSINFQTAQATIGYLDPAALCALDATSRAWHACVTPRWRPLLDAAWACIAVRAAAGYECGCFKPGVVPRLPAPHREPSGEGGTAAGDGAAAAVGKAPEAVSAKQGALRLGALLSLQACTVDIGPGGGGRYLKLRFKMEQPTLPGALFYATVHDLESRFSQVQGPPINAIEMIRKQGAKSLFHEFASLLTCGFGRKTRVDVITVLRPSRRLATAHVRRPSEYAQLGSAQHTIPQQRLCPASDLAPVLALCSGVNQRLL